MISPQLLKISLFSAELKKNLSKIYFSTYDDLIMYVEGEIKKNGYQVAFPVNICPDYLMSNWTPCYGDRLKQLSYKICTIDLGVQLGEHIVDTAITLIKDPVYQPYLLYYRQLLRELEIQLNFICQKRGYLTGEDITENVHEKFKNSGFFMVPYCCAHTIQKYCLHGKTISMVKPGVPNVKLEQGCVFTIEPHVALKPFKSKLLKGTIGKSKNNSYDTLDNRLGKNINPETWQLYHSLILDQLCFYQEQTYTISNHQLINLTKV